MGVCANCTLAYSYPLKKGAFDDVGHSNSSVTNTEYYAKILKQYEIQSDLAINKVPLLLNYWTSVIGKTPLSILEIGCGTGQYYEAWKKAGVDWIGVEVNETMLAFCTSRNMPVYELDKVINTNKKFDVIFMSQVLEHILEPIEFLKTVGKLLNDHSILYLDVPNQDSITSLYRRINLFHPEYGFVQPMHHLIAYTQKSLKYLLKHCGFEIKHIGAHTEDEVLFGQLLATSSLLQRLAFVVSRFTKRGSLLVCVASKSG
jgi:2-polyprenyl-3-methyl-5-hydroxy-6-metoxy-1,4-benzoquinol methylase